MQTAAAWALFTRLGEAQILLPAMAAALAWLARRRETRPLALTWLAAVAAAAAATTATKVAFIGYTVGYAPWDYTGISGHAMFAAAVLPVLAHVAVGVRRPPWPALAVAAGVLLAAAIAVSRVATREHSAIESAFGFVLGLAASTWTLRRAPGAPAPTPAWLFAGVAVWLVALPATAPPSRTHDWVTALSLQVSGRPAPYTRHEMHRRAALGQAPSRAGLEPQPAEL